MTTSKRETYVEINLARKKNQIFIDKVPSSHFKKLTNVT